MMRVWLNGEPRDVTEGATLSSILEEEGLGKGAGAVAVNMAVVPRSLLNSTRLREGDRVEVIEAVGGG